MCGTNAGCLQKKKRKLESFGNTGEKMKTNPPQKILGMNFLWELFTTMERQSKTQALGKEKLYFTGTDISSARLQFHSNELAPLMIFSRSSSFFLPSLSLSLDIKCCTDFFCVCVNNYTQTHSKQLDVEVIYNSSENGDTHIHTNTQVNIHHALGNFLVGK